MTEAEAPLGRTREFDEIWQRVSEAPSFVLIVGAAGSGRSTLVRAFVEKAGREGIFGGSVLDGISEYNSRRYLREQLDPEGHLPFPGGTNVVEYASSVVDRLRRAPEGEQVPTERLYVVDGYRPSPEADEWFAAMAKALIAGEKRGSAIIVTGAEDRLASLSTAASHTLQLGPLESDAVRARLEEVGASLDPALAEHELEAYVSAAAHQPSVLEDLVTLFAFTGGVSR